MSGDEIRGGKAEVESGRVKGRGKARLGLVFQVRLVTLPKPHHGSSHGRCNQNISRTNKLNAIAIHSGTIRHRTRVIYISGEVALLLRLSFVLINTANMSESR